MIHEFQNEYRWLSNFYSVTITLDGIEYPSVEHAFMSAKSNDPEWKKFCSDPKNTAAIVKKAGKTVNLRKDWDKVKISVMEDCLRQKFNQEPFKTDLLKTENQNIQEGNRWNDKFWGVDLKESPNIGENYLGRLIMKIRRELQIQKLESGKKTVIDFISNSFKKKD